ncbi:PRC-barrel domain-containing protein [Cyanobacterium sp. uoEpiScrs1]|uniref:PRC-barrel domain-containing protein n=1 Tax=Cyanobacterium sp. uoEpiScrs1 TaxID=2976343 RepID=UPI00226A8BE4|nr:PRC-barrel domain-containing protein [Cyanobacterium sp. uoEpiScrs1]
MTSDKIRLRNEFINTQVITRNTGKKLGVVKEVLVDIDRREVVSLGLRDNMLSLSGIPRYMYLSSSHQIGDVVLVEDEDVVTTVDIDTYSSVVNCEVITETGESLGRVRDFEFNIETGKVSSIIIASLGLPQIPDRLISTYELSIEQVISSGPNRLIVFEGAEEQLVQITVGVLERLGIGRPPWEKEEEDIYYPPTTRPDNQLGTGIPVRTHTPFQERQSVIEEQWDEDTWEQPIAASPPKKQTESIRYEELEEDNWGEVKVKRKTHYEPPRQEREYKYDEVRGDVWDDDVELESYNPPRVDIPQKQKQPEYYEEEA